MTSHSALSSLVHVARTISSKLRSAEGAKICKLARDDVDLLVNHMSCVTFQTLGICESKLAEILTNPMRGPISYMQIYEDPSYFSLGMFAIGADSQMPIHDHTNMYGIIKPIFGNGLIQAFSRKDVSTRLEVGQLIPVQPIDVQFLSSSENTCSVLDPLNGNIHAISSTPGCGPFAFMDLLLPPYDHVSQVCNYFQKVDSDSSSTQNADHLLEVIDEPPDYYCESIFFRDVRSS